MHINQVLHTIGVDRIDHGVNSLGRRGAVQDHRGARARAHRVPCIQSVLRAKPHGQRDPSHAARSECALR